MVWLMRIACVCYCCKWLEEMGEYAWEMIIVIDMFTCVKVAAGVGGSSRVWLCATSHVDGQPNTVVYVLDAHNPGSPLETFSLLSTHILCIASVSSTSCSCSCVASQSNL